MKLYSIILNFLALIFQLKCFKVGFFTLNLEANELSKETIIDGKQTSTDMDLIFSSLNKIADLKQSEKLKPILDPEDPAIENEKFREFSVLYFSFQEFQRTEDLERMKNIIESDGKFQCKELHSRGLGKGGKFLLSFKYTAAMICWDRQHFLERLLFKRDSSLTSKAILGSCIKPYDGTHTYCFLGTHAEVKFRDSVTEYVKSIKTIKNELPDDDLKILILGDTNLLSLQDKYFDEDIMEYKKLDISQKGDPNKGYDELMKLWEFKLHPELIDSEIGNSFSDQDYMFKKGDENSIDIYKELFEEEARKEGVEDSKIYWLGVENIRRLPPTYKFNRPSDYKEREIFDYNKKFYHTLKNVGLPKKANFFGLLDRLICFDTNFLPNVQNDNYCDVIDHTVIYKTVPKLRISDHMAIVGSFEIDYQRKRKRFKKFK